MHSSLFQAICRVGIFMICAQAIVHFRPKEAYEKYLKLLVSIMVLIQLFLPVGGFFLGRGGEETAQALEQFKHDLEESMKHAEENAAAADEILEKMTLEEVLSRLEAQQEELQSGREQGERQEEVQSGRGQGEQQEEVQSVGEQGEQRGKVQSNGEQGEQQEEVRIGGEQGEFREERQSGGEQGVFREGGELQEEKPQEGVLQGSGKEKDVINVEAIEPVSIKTETTREADSGDAR